MAINGTIVNPGDVVNFTYSGDIQEWIVPVSGLYEFKVWGASSPGVGVGYAWNVPKGGNGGYSYGYRVLTKGTVLYVVCGGQPSSTVIPQSDNAYHEYNGGYNGGGKARLTTIPAHRCTQGGGGATHIATKTGLLSTLSDDIDSILIVASGGGGSFSYRNYANDGTPKPGSFVGGSGGGETGNAGQGVSIGGGGTQSKGGTAGLLGKSAGSFGQGGDWGGGGGLYGGGSASTNGDSGGGAGGGSGYIGGVPEIVFNGKNYTPETTNGVWSGAGKAAITLIEMVGLNNILAFGDEDIGMVVGDLEITGISFGDILLQSQRFYTITYIWDGNSNQEKVEKGKSVLNPTSFTPEKTDNIFIGWSTESSGTNPAEELVATKDITLYACWAASTLVVFSKSSSDGTPSINNSDYVTLSGAFALSPIGRCIGNIWYREGSDTQTGSVTIKPKAPYTKATITLKCNSSGFIINGEMNKEGKLNISGSFGSAERYSRPLSWSSDSSDFTGNATGTSLTLNATAYARNHAGTGGWAVFGAYISNITLSV